MNVKVQERQDEAVAATLPGDIVDDNWVAKTGRAGVPSTRADLLATYGTADPDELAARFAIAEDVATARALAGAR